MWLSQWCCLTISSSVAPLLLISVFPSIRVFSSELPLWIRWSKYRSFSLSISPSKEYSGLIFSWYIHLVTLFKSLLRCQLLSLTDPTTLSAISWTILFTTFPSHRPQRLCPHPALFLFWHYILYVPEKHRFLLYWLYQSLWLCGSQQTMENSERDGNTRPPDLPLEKSVYRSGSNS